MPSSVRSCRKRDRDAVERRNAEMQRPPRFVECAEVWGVVVSYLLVEDMNQVRQVSHKLSQATFDFKAKILRAYVRNCGFGAARWERYFGKVEKIRLPLKIYDILRGPCPFFPEEKVKDTHILFYLPQKVEGKPLTLNSLEELVKKPKEGSQGNSTQYRVFDAEVKKELGDQAINQPCWVLMTKGFIPGSEGKSFDEQHDLCSKIKGYQAPKVVEVAAGIFLSYVVTGTSPGSDHPNPFTYTYCEEQIQRKGIRVIAGGFTDPGLYVGLHNYTLNEYCGLFVLRKFLSA